MTGGSILHVEGRIKWASAPWLYVLGHLLIFHGRLTNSRGHLFLQLWFYESHVRRLWATPAANWLDRTSDGKSGGNTYASICWGFTINSSSSSLRPLWPPGSTLDHVLIHNIQLWIITTYYDRYRPFSYQRLAFCHSCWIYSILGGFLDATGHSQWLECTVRQQSVLQNQFSWSLFNFLRNFSWTFLMAEHSVQSTSQGTTRPSEHTCGLWICAKHVLICCGKIVFVCTYCPQKTPCRHASLF